MQPYSRLLHVGQSCKADGKKKADAEGGFLATPTQLLPCCQDTHTNLQPCQGPGKKGANRRRMGFFQAVASGRRSRAGTDRSLDGNKRRPSRMQAHLTPSSPARGQAKRETTGDAWDFSKRWRDSLSSYQGSRRAITAREKEKENHGSGSG
jgi:hypothetical protein